MQWLSENWIWLAFAVGMLAMMRGGAHGGCGGGHGRHGSEHEAPRAGNTIEGSARRER